METPMDKPIIFIMNAFPESWTIFQTSSENFWKILFLHIWIFYFLKIICLHAIMQQTKISRNILLVYQAAACDGQIYQIAYGNPCRKPKRFFLRLIHD